MNDTPYASAAAIRDRIRGEYTDLSGQNHLNGGNSLWDFFHTQDLRTRRQQDRDKEIFQLLAEKVRPGFEVGLIDGLPQGARVLAQRHSSQVAAG